MASCCGRPWKRLGGTSAQYLPDHGRNGTIKTLTDLSLGDLGDNDERYATTYFVLRRGLSPAGQTSVRWPREDGKLRAQGGCLRRGRQGPRGVSDRQV